MKGKEWRREGKMVNDEDLQKHQNAVQCKDLRGSRLSEIPREITALNLAMSKGGLDTEKVRSFSLLCCFKFIIIF